MSASKDVATVDLMTTDEVASLMRVDPKTVTRWVKQGRIRKVRYPGRSLRFRSDYIKALVQGKV